MHSNKIMHNPVDIQSFLEALCVLCIHIGLPPIRRTPASQRRMEGCEMIGMNILSGHRLYRVGMLGIRSLILRPFGTSPTPLGPFVLESHFDALGQRLLWAPPLASS